MASEILEDLKLEPNGEEDNEEAPEKEVIEQESRDVPEKELSGETKEETEEKKSVEESKEEEPKNSEKPKRGRKKSLKSDSSGGKDVSAKKKEKLDHESGDKKEPTTPASERPTKERKTVERYSAPSLARSSSSRGLSLENGRGTLLNGIPNGMYVCSSENYVNSQTVCEQN
ncbi:protein DEK isoform X4 [Tripterygium wilfordii]|uniref:Protein DEK isoform X4 n=1 Tax=Tripterygium wilfordii TaxID=458696 RepID=A0A7J7DC84_TRIWF|nr:protein DEK isoform X4 [Tripterygium wilfordii]